MQFFFFSAGRKWGLWIQFRCHSKTEAHRCLLAFLRTVFFFFCWLLLYVLFFFCFLIVLAPCILIQFFGFNVPMCFFFFCLFFTAEMFFKSASTIFLISLCRSVSLHGYVCSAVCAYLHMYSSSCSFFFFFDICLNSCFHFFLLRHVYAIFFFFFVAEKLMTKHN